MDTEKSTVTLCAPAGLFDVVSIGDESFFKLSRCIKSLYILS